MKISKYGVTLTKLTEDKLEMTRNWRNDPKISQYMEYKEYITPEMQAKWFQSINNDNNYYFIIEYSGKEIGLINVRDIDYEKGEGEAGFYIYDEDFLSSTVPFRASLCLYDFCVEELKLKRLIAHILRDNKRAIKYNLLFGYVKQPGQDDIMNQLYVSDLESFKKTKSFILKLLND